MSPDYAIIALCSNDTYSGEKYELARIYKGFLWAVCLGRAGPGWAETFENVMGQAGPGGDF